METLFVCDKCNYKTQRKTDWLKHINTKKHNNRVNSVLCITDTCVCEYKSKYRQSLLRHLKTCKVYLQRLESDKNNINSDKNNTINDKNNINIEVKDINEQLDITDNINQITEQTQKEENPPITTELIFKLIKQNEELRELIVQQNNMFANKTAEFASQQSQIMEYCKQPKSVKNIKNKFNLNFFLNVQCKDAVNITDFMRNITVNLTDLEHVGKNGYVEGVSRIIINALSELDLYKRPIHCTDVKREVLFVKDEDKWEKDANGVKVRKVIGHVAQKNCQTLCTVIKPEMIMAEHPDCEKNLRMMRNINGGGADALMKNHEKIISLISQNVMLEPQ